jgi:hypothetical protein
LKNEHHFIFGNNIADSVTNPFNLPATSGKKLYLNAQKAFLKNNTYGWFLKGIKYCPSSSINLRHIDFTNGSYLIYGSDTLIHSTQRVNASISFASRQNYYCSIKPLTTPSSADSVKFYLADVERGIDMIALIKGSQDTLPSRYDSIHKNYTSVSI